MILNFQAITVVLSRSAATMIEVLKSVEDMYTSRGFNISICHGDNEFNAVELKAEFRNVIFNIIAA